MVTKLKNFFDKEKREDFLKYVKSRYKMREVSDDRKTCWLYRRDNQDMFNFLTNLANFYGPFHGVKEPLTMYEIQVAFYTPPGDSYKGIHRDTVPSTPRSHLRKISMSIELSDNYKGKGILFKGIPSFEVSIGDAIIFNSEEWHAPAPVLEGERISMIAWFYEKSSDFLSYPSSWDSTIEKKKKSRVPADIDAAFKSIGKETPKNLHI